MPRAPRHTGVSPKIEFTVFLPIFYAKGASDYQNIIFRQVRVPPSLILFLKGAMSPKKFGSTGLNHIIWFNLQQTVDEVLSGEGNAVIALIGVDPVISSTGTGWILAFWQVLGKCWKLLLLLLLGIRVGFDVKWCDNVVAKKLFVVVVDSRSCCWCCCCCGGAISLSPPWWLMVLRVKAWMWQLDGDDESLLVVLCWDLLWNFGQGTIQLLTFWNKLFEIFITNPKKTWFLKPSLKGKTLYFIKFYKKYIFVTLT